MPKRKSTVTNQQSDEDYEEAGPSQALTQSMTQASKSLGSVSAEDIENKVNDLVRFLLIMDQKKMPIKKLDIKKNVLKECGKDFALFIQKAGEKLQEIFGIQLKEVDGKQKTYILINMLDNDSEKPHLTWSGEENGKVGLLMVVLSIIFMKGGIIQDTELYHALKKVGVDVDANHEMFGDVKKLLSKELVQQSYLSLERIPNSDPPSYDFTWGSRAHMETSKRNVLDFVCQIYGNVDPEQWKTQWAQVMKAEGGAINGHAPDASGS